MRTLQIHIPDNIDLSEQEASTALAAQLYEMGKLSLGQAADLAGYTKATFMELLGKHNISLFNHPADELDSDVANAKNYHS